MDNVIDYANWLRKVIEELAQTAPDEEAEKYQILHPEWSGEEMDLTAGQRIRFKDKLYKVLVSHRTQPDWTPENAPSLFAEVLTSEIPGEVLDWKQPDSTNGYSIGDRVIHNGHIWESDTDNNVWEPGVIGTESLWHKVEN